MLILVFFIVFVFTFVLGLTARSLLSTVQTLLREEVSPLLNSARQSINTVQGTTAFIGETAVAPLIRAYGVVVGARRALGVLSGILPRQDRHE